MSPKVAAAKGASKITVPNRFGDGIDDDMSDAHAEASKISEQINRDVVPRNQAIKEQVS